MDFLGNILSGQDLVNKDYVDKAIPVVPTKVSAFTNDAGYITAEATVNKAYQWEYTVTLNKANADEIGNVTGWMNKSVGSTNMATSAGTIMQFGSHVSKVQIFGGYAKNASNSGDKGYHIRKYYADYGWDAWEEIITSGNFSTYLGKEVVNTGNTLSFGSAIIIGTIGGTQLTAALPSVASVKSTLGLGNLAYKNSLVASDIPALSYLPLSGGTITGTLTLSKEGSDILVINRLNSSSPTTITYRKDGDLLGRMGFDASTKEPVAQVSGSYQTLIHSGNIGSYKAGDSTLLGGKAVNEFAYVGTYPEQGNYNYSMRSGIYRSNGKEEGLPNINSGCSVIHTNFDSNAANQLFLDRTKDFFAYRRKTGRAWSAWKTIAFTDSDITGNAATATKLQTARTIWGQSFDGTGNVTGNLYLGSNILYGGNNYNILDISGGSGLNIGYGIRSVGSTVYWAKSHAFYVGDSHALTVNSSGNVGIGTASPSEKLHVAGKGLFTDNLTSQGNVIGAAAIICKRSDWRTNLQIGSTGNRGIYDETAAQWVIYTNGTNTYLPLGALTVSGATTLSSTLDVSGLLTAKGGINVTASDGALNTGQGGVAGVFLRNEGGIEISHASTPYIDFHYAAGTTDFSHRLIARASNIFAYSGNYFCPWGSESLGASSYRWKAVYAKAGSFSNDMEINGALTVGAGATFNGDVRINGNLVVTGDTASGGAGQETTSTSQLLVINQIIPEGTSVTQSALDAIGLTSDVIDDLLEGKYHHVLEVIGSNKSLYTISGYKSTTTREFILQYGSAEADTAWWYSFRQYNGGNWSVTYGEI